MLMLKVCHQAALEKWFAVAPHKSFASWCLLAVASHGVAWAVCRGLVLPDLSLGWYSKGRGRWGQTDETEREVT